EAVRGQLVGTEEPEVPRAGGAGEDVAQELAELPGRFAALGPGRLHRNGVLRVVGKVERLEQVTAVHVRIGAHAPRAGRRPRPRLLARRAALVEQLLWPVGPHP